MPMPTDFAALSDEQIAGLDASLAGQEQDKWQPFYDDRDKACPFFVPHPDENLVQWVSAGQIEPGRALDLGCGNGRNALYLANRGFSVEGVDYSASAVAWSRERVAQAGAPVSIVQRSVFELDLPPASYDLVYDSGCFHHIPPHRRHPYVRLVANALKPGGAFGLVCFKPEGGSGYSDEDVYRHRSLGGGLGYIEQQLREIWSGPLRIDVLRPMEESPPASGVFGRRFLWCLLARKA
jgi:SAM-dependent methyltransferase